MGSMPFYYPYPYESYPQHAVPNGIAPPPLPPYFFPPQPIPQFQAPPISNHFVKEEKMFEKGASTGNANGNKMNVRVDVLEGLLQSMANDGATAKANALRLAIRRNKADMADTPAKSLDLMRRIFQNDITNELRQIIDRHLRTTFSPAIENLRRNGHEVGAAEMNQLCRRIFDAAKEGLHPHMSRKRGGQDIHESQDTDTEKTDRSCCESDDSDASALSFNAEKKKRRGRTRRDEEAIMNDQSEVTLNETIKWNPDRFTPQSRFLFASRVAATLSMPTSLFFSKYRRFFRYACDEEDKLELYDGGRLSRMSGKALLVTLQDALEVVGGHSPELERYSFPVSENILNHMKERSQRVYEHLCLRVAPSVFPFNQFPI